MDNGGSIPEKHRAYMARTACAKGLNRSGSTRTRLMVPLSGEPLEVWFTTRCYYALGLVYIGERAFEG